MRLGIIFVLGKSLLSKITYKMEELVEKLKECIATNSVNVTNACTLFGFQYRNSIIQLLTKGEHNISDIVKEAYDGASSFDTEVRAGMNIYDNINKCSSSSNITYDFMPQVFTNALVKAYKSESQVYLVIEEINRGNCAQIFGDIFQLLDRNGNGESEYSISVDEDLRKYLETNCPESIKEGKIKLPANLSIIATMNTSDQSLFPMDSAFKRRWEWVYVPIKYNNFDKDGNPVQFRIIVEKDKFEYDWNKFQKSVNGYIVNTTHSEDKQMGDYFIKKNVTLDEFVNKVMFYLWNDVCKENYHTEDNFFRTKDEDANEETEFSFGELMTDKANLIIGFMHKLNVDNLIKESSKDEDDSNQG